MTNNPLFVSFVWHMHQPYYKDPTTDIYRLPWVRLHGTKDYLDMLEVVKDFPGTTQNFNVVPSLLEQVNDYTENNARDSFLDATTKRVSDLDPDEKLFILENFFLANWENMIKPFPRYYELLLKIGTQQRPWRPAADIAASGALAGLTGAATSHEAGGPAGTHGAAEQWAQYKELQRSMKVSAVGAERLRALRAALDAQGQPQRPLLVALDGTFTNQTLFRVLPERRVAIGRLRKDAKLFVVPPESDSPRRGRKRFYGQPLPSPEQLRQDASIPWIEVKAWAAGQLQSFGLKTCSPVRWRGPPRPAARAACRPPGA